jgi:hypothetical protein
MLALARHWNMGMEMATGVPRSFGTIKLMQGIDMIAVHGSRHLDVLIMAEKIQDSQVPNVKLREPFRQMGMAC